ncbi:fumarylacetoacetate hydrolase family protein [Microbacterium karelineae]|uniref:fumarylacetoacetate hydrolase family protein n=1 Tax=Microbacterium karelineae TaxID=2654283 RepID=UPI0012EA5330|nr:fumarylacetoacetate hydrolase family protein [Microbacterium karelineae]
MRIGRWIRDGRHEDGFIDDTGVVPFPGGLLVADVLAAGLGALAELRARAGDPVTALDAVALRAPLDPASVRDFVAFEEHVEGVSAGVEGKSHVADEWYEAPTFYFTNPHTIAGPGETITPPETHRLDFELEVAAVIGRSGTDLTAQEAGDAIFGYTIMNDWSARDLQAREMKVRLGPCKGKDFAMTLGPWIVTADELARFEDGEGFLAVRAEVVVNGERYGEDLVSNMGWPFAELVAYASRASRIVPGDVLGSGTVGNGGCLGELWGRGSDLPPLEEGDEVRMVVEGIGELTGSVGASRPAPPLPRARVRPRIRHR